MKHQNRYMDRKFNPKPFPLKSAAKVGAGAALIGGGAYLGYRALKNRKK